ncbi:hypothetical protein K1T71_013981 [Dendrolimus kikuchii]|uniref:Uncharacterized protein n=1 Tax=Dendrolimus kikuchii TaxID=765133 RepID=A0ACC1CG95_9NEOP|nr:hypothetical protein K1T71_013981 [Dendrolimus kikuchii]
MNQCCLICNAKTGVTLRSSAIILFGEHTNLPSGRKLPEVVSEIIDKPVVKDNVHSDIICKKCSKTCNEYDALQLKLYEMRNDMQEQFKTSIQSYELTYNNYTTDVKKSSKKSQQSVIKSAPKKVVVPASKLQPIPPDMYLKVGKLPVATHTINSAGRVIPTSFPHFKSIGNSIITTTSAGTNKQTVKQVENIYTIEGDIDTVVANKSDISVSPIKNNVLTFNINNLPKDLLSSMLISKIETIAQGSSEENSKDAEETNNESNNEQNDMEIDEVFALSVVPVTTDDGDLVLEVEGLKKEKGKNDDEYIDVSMLESVATSGDDNFILGKLRILNEDEVQNVDGDDDDDAHSNDGSQIELQVSGDEETANAIIMAAQETGGAFIKVESGEMYCVQSVESKRQEESETITSQSVQMVAQEGDMFRCLLCERPREDGQKQKRFVGEAEAMMRHLKSAHDARTYICQLCGVVMRKRSEYTLHIAEHAQSLKSESSNKYRMHECSVCHKSYSSRTLLMEHMNVHSGDRPYVCHLCNKSFASKYTHQAHLKTHAVRPRPFQCKQCGKAFLTTQNLAQHEKTHSGVKDFVCNICNKAFSTQHNLEVHAVVHSGEKPFVCSVCNKGFARRAECKDHMRIHTGERPFECDICGARFTQNSNLHSHKRATHLDDRRYHCEHCPKKFKRKRLLEYHIKATHTGERPLVCKVCGSTFVYPEHYKKHVRIHSGERPYVCEICGKSFNSPDNRNTHRFTHSDKKLYECFTCGAGFMRKQLLYMHMNTSGHLAESIVVNQPRVTKAIENTTATHYIEDNGNEYKLTTEADSATIFESAQELVLEGQDKNEDDDIPKYFVTTAKSGLNVLQEGEDVLLNLNNLGEQTGVMSNDENGSTVRLIQIKLPDGHDGWVAINN